MVPHKFRPAGSGSGYGSRRGKMTHEIEIKEEIASFKVLDVLF
jgi:hypothetical protein